MPPAAAGRARRPGCIRDRQRGVPGGEPDRHPALAAAGDHALVPAGQQPGQCRLRIGPPALPGGQLARVPGRFSAERRSQPGRVLPLQPVPGIAGRVAEVDVPHVVRVHPDRPLARMQPAVGAFGITVTIQCGAVIAQPADLDTVMLDGPPLGRKEVINQLRGGRDAQQPGPGDPDLIHLIRRQLQVRPLRHREPVLLAAVIDTTAVHSRITSSSSWMNKNAASSRPSPRL